MTTEQAAERLRRLYGGASYYTIYGCHHTLGGEQHEDERKVINAYLAERDPTPIDEAWLKSVGGKKDDHPQKITFHRDDSMSIELWNANDGWKAMLVHSSQHQSCIVRGLKTRGDVRRLAQCLGITLHEDTNQRSEP